MALDRLLDDAGKFKEVVRPVGKAVVWKPFVTVAGHEITPIPDASGRWRG